VSLQLCDGHHNMWRYDSSVMYVQHDVQGATQCLCLCVAFAGGHSEGVQYYTLLMLWVSVNRHKR
jgi:hypothetical protein